MISNVDNDADINYDDFTTEELQFKINTFLNLYLRNKINTSNAFDIDIIGCFATWLARKKFMNNFDIESFREIAEYLGVAEKVYSLRVDNFSQLTNKLVEEFKTINLNNANLISENKVKQLKTTKPKKRKTMLTTSLKLSKIENNSLMKQNVFHFDLNELLKTNQRPSNFMMSLYSNYFPREREEKANDEKLVNDEKNFFSMPDLENELTKGVICPMFSDLDFENVKYIDVEEIVMEGIEYRFDPKNHFQNSSSIENHGECSSSSNVDNQSSTSGLLDCIDNVIRDYSFFNPQLLANWKGPEPWKTQAMMKALKPCNSNEQTNILSIPNNSDDLNTLQTKQNTKKKLSLHHTPIIWRTMEEIKNGNFLKVNCTEMVNPELLKQWNPKMQMEEFPLVGIKHKFEFLKYFEVLLDSSISEKNTSKNFTELNDEYQHVYNIHDATDDIDNTNEIDESVDLSLVLPTELIQSNKSEKSFPGENIFKESKNLSIVDIDMVKKEISEIIDQECIEINSDNEWSSKLLFSNLLKKLQINERRLSVSIVFVCLLHLANERGLKLLKESNASDVENEICISKPLNKV